MKKSKSKNVWHKFKSFHSFHSRGKSDTRFCMFPKVKSAGDIAGLAPVYLNVYDLTPANGYFYWAGFGVFHTGVEVHGVEYAFGAHEYSTSGVFEVEPRQCPGFEFRKSIFMGMTHLDPIRVREFMEWQSANYHGDMYHLVVKNCNHFSEDICYKLSGKRIPKWVNRLARVGSLCSCILPETLKSSAVRPDPNFQGYDSIEKKKLRSPFGCFASISMNPKEVEREETVSSMFLHSHYNDCLTPLELKKNPKLSP